MFEFVEAVRGLGESVGMAVESSELLLEDLLVLLLPELFKMLASVLSLLVLFFDFCVKL